MIISFNTDQFKSFEKQLQKVVAETPEKIDQALMKAGFLVERESKKLSPVRTGRMRGSIAVESEVARRNQHHVVIQPHTNYAEFVHRRTPFMTAGFYNAKDRIDTLFEKLVIDALSNVK